MMENTERINGKSKPLDNENPFHDYDKGKFGITGSVTIDLGHYHAPNKDKLGYYKPSMDRVWCHHLSSGVTMQINEPHNLVAIEMLDLAATNASAAVDEYEIIKEELIEAGKEVPPKVPTRATRGTPNPTLVGPTPAYSGELKKVVKKYIMEYARRKGFQDPLYNGRIETFYMKTFRSLRSDQSPDYAEMLHQGTITYGLFRIGYYQESGDELQHAIYAVKEMMVNHLAECLSLKSGARGKWTLPFIVMMCFHMKAYTNLPPPLFSLDHDTDKKLECVRKKNIKWVNTALRVPGRQANHEDDHPRRPWNITPCESNSITIEKRDDVVQQWLEFLNHGRPEAEHYKVAEEYDEPPEEPTPQPRPPSPPQETNKKRNKRLNVDPLECKLEMPPEILAEMEARAMGRSRRTQTGYVLPTKRSPPKAASASTNQGSTTRPSKKSKGEFTSVEPTPVRPRKQVASKSLQIRANKARNTTDLPTAGTKQLTKRLE